MKHRILFLSLCFGNLFSTIAQFQAQEPQNSPFEINQESCLDEFHEMMKTTGALKVLAKVIERCRAVIDNKQIHNPYNQDPKVVYNYYMEEYSKHYASYLSARQNVEKCLEAGVLTSSHQEAMEKRKPQNI